jgi:hypothetical protein
MKWFLSFAISLLFLPLFSQEDAIAKHFDQYLSDASFKSVYVSPKMFDVIATSDIEKMDPEVKALIKNLRGLRVLQREGQSGVALFKEANKKLTAAKYDELMTLNENNEQIRFYTMGPGKKVQELLLMVAGPNRFLMLTMVGDIDLNAVAKLSKNLNLQGADYLDKVKSR